MGNLKKTPMFVAAFSLVLALLCAPAYGEDGSSLSEEWEFTVIPYLWMTGLEGDIGVKGVTAHVDASFSDILDNLDLAAQVHLEARKGKWAFFLDPTYLRIVGNETAASPFGGSLDVEVTTEAWLVEGGAFYRIAESAVGDDGVRSIAVDLLGGFRYNYLKAGVDVEGSINVDVEESKDWLDPIVGGRIQARLSKKLLLNLRGDIGGFGISDASDSTWSLLAALGYQLNERTTLLVGYRALAVDYDEGSGSDLFEYDVTMSGPFFGTAIKF
jgi:hypothetical protein